MKAPLILSLALVIFATSCSQSRQDGGAVAQLERTQVEAKPQSSSPQAEKTSLAEVDKATSTAEALDRKIIRNADITIEAASTTEAQYRVTEIAEAHGGFVITSEAKQRENMDASKRTFDIELVARVPSAEFGPALEEIKKLASNIPRAHITSQDVTEDFIDLEARIKTQKAVELQFLEIMKQANKVPDALEVQRQIAEVRTDIEKLEGRKRFLENRSSLSTITVNIQAPKLITVSTTGFRSGLRDAVSDSLELASGMVVFFVRLLIVMAPVLVFIVLPVGLAFRYLMRRVKRIRLAQALATPTAE